MFFSQSLHPFATMRNTQASNRPRTSARWLIGLDEGHLEDVFRNVGAPGHPERMPKQRIGVTMDEEGKGVAITREDSRDDLLIRINLVYLLGGHRRFHGLSIILSPTSR